jgi:dihydrodipicolinate synthase/N-acetylneuraminate lyase
MPRYPQAVLVSCEIPWDEKEHLKEDVFRKEVRHTLRLGFHHVYVFGTAGEGYAVDTRRFQQIVRVFREETGASHVHPMVGVIGLSTANVVERVAFAHDAGFRTFQVAMPSWGALNDTEVLTFFRDVCGTFPDARFLHYNLPRAKRVLGGPDYRRLVEAVPNLAATKNTGGGLGRAADLMRHAPELQHFFGEENFPHGCLYGECSLLASFAAMAPGKTRELFEAGRNRQMEKLFLLQKGFHDMAIDVFGPLLAQDRIDGAYDKMIVRLGGLGEMPIRLLSPYQGFTEEQYRECERIFREKYPDWAGA